MDRYFSLNYSLSLLCHEVSGTGFDSWYCMSACV